MLKRLVPASLVVLLAAACGGPEFDVRAEGAEGLSFHPQVVDLEQDAGAGLSITTDVDGNPHLAYLKLPGPPEEQPEAPDPLAPALPAVAHAHLVDDIWTHSEVAESPGPDEGGPPLALTPEDETAIVVDEEGTHHVAWTEGGEVLYSTDTTGEEEPQVVASVDATGLAIAVNGTDPGLVFWEAQSDPEGPTALLRFATFQGKGWELETVAEGEPAGPAAASVGLGAGADGTALVAYASGDGVVLATRGPARWDSEPVDAEGQGGVSMDVDADGNPHLAYLTSDGQVRHAHSIGGGEWEISDVGAGVAEASTSIAVDDEGIHHIAWQRDVDPAYANNAGGEFAEVQLPASTAGGSRARVAAGAGAAYLAWYSQEGTRISLATYSEDAPLIAVPSPDAPPGGGTAPAECEPEGDTLTIAAQGLEFDKDCLAVIAGQPYTIEFDNQEAVPHNVNVYTDDTATEPVLQEPNEGTITGPSQTTYQGDPIEEPGELFFQCDVHPTTMTGTFVVAEK